MKKLKFLFTASRASHIENFHMPAINALRQNGHTVDTATEGYVKENLVDHSYNLIFQKKIYSPRNIGTINQLSKIIKSNSYDVILLLQELLQDLQFQSSKISLIIYTYVMATFLMMIIQKKQSFIVV